MTALYRRLSMFTYPEFAEKELTYDPPLAPMPEMQEVFIEE
jgi:hypothetical protein